MAALYQAPKLSFYSFSSMTCRNFFIPRYIKGDKKPLYSASGIDMCLRLQIRLAASIPKASNTKNMRPLLKIVANIVTKGITNKICSANILSFNKPHKKPVTVLSMHVHPVIQLKIYPVKALKKNPQLLLLPVLLIMQKQ